ncbi:hypothetical protein NMY22_g4914 [Coprinellus aureogranulatus]|nr:hypothetical protein NMY22_g4914 [Coprinellus aureogranulatus]
MPNLPVELLIEIMLLLEPKDLLTMARANKLFRRALVNDRRDIDVWRVKRKEFDAPDPPPGCAPQFVSMVTALNAVHSAGLRRLQQRKVGSQFYRLRGSANRQSSYIADEDLNSDLDKTILDGVPYTTGAFCSPIRHVVQMSDHLLCEDGPSTKDDTDLVYRWKDEVDEVASRWYMYEEMYEDGTPGAMEEFVAWWNERLEYVQWLDLNDHACTQWAEALKEKRSQDRSYINEIRVETVRRHFYDLGYEMADVDAVVHLAMRTSVARRTGLHPEVEPQIILAGDTRRYSLKLDLVETRMVLLRALWRHWLASLDLATSEELRYPPEWYLAEHPLLTPILEAGPEVPVTPEIMEFVLDHLPGIAQDYDDLRREELVEQLPSSSYANRLELATSVFTPPPNAYPESHNEGRHGLVIGWKMHSMCHGWEPEEEGDRFGFEVEMHSVGQFHEDLSELARSLVLTCGRDPRTYTAARMDRLDKRFLCRECMDSELKEQLGQRHLGGNVRRTPIQVKVFTWRAALSHAWKEHEDEIGQLVFTVLDDPVLLRMARGREEHLREERGRHLAAWYCNHCAGPNDGEAASERAVRAHLARSHGIGNPGDGDIAFSELYRSCMERPATLRVLCGRTETLRPA